MIYKKHLSGGWVAIYNENDKIYYFNLNTFNSTTNKEKTVPEEQTTSAAALASVRDALRLAMDDHATIATRIMTPRPSATRIMSPRTSARRIMPP